MMPARPALVTIALMLCGTAAAAAAAPVPAAAAAAAGAGPGTAPATAPAGSEPFVIQSHRGAGALAPENTVEAFELAWSLGTYPEADLRTTRDGVIACFHDNDFARLVRGADEAMRKRGVADLTWDEVARLDVGAYKGERFAGQRVPRAADLFARMAGRPDRRAYLDIKNVDLAKLADEVRAHGVERQVILASTKYDLVRKWKALVPESGTLLWMGGGEEELRKRIDDLRKADFAGVTQLQIHVRLRGPKQRVDAPDPFTPSDAFLSEVARELRPRGIAYQALPWGSKDPAVYRKLMDLGVQSFATDHPDVTVEAVRRYRAERGRQAPTDAPAQRAAER